MRAKLNFISLSAHKIMSAFGCAVRDSGPRKKRPLLLQNASTKFVRRPLVLLKFARITAIFIPGIGAQSAFGRGPTFGDV